MTRKRINIYKDNCHCGDIIIVLNPTESNKELIKATVCAKYTDFVMVTNGNYKWCVNWVDVMQNN